MFIQIIVIAVCGYLRVRYPRLVLILVLYYHLFYYVNTVCCYRRVWLPEDEASRFSWMADGEVTNVPLFKDCLL